LNMKPDLLTRILWLDIRFISDSNCELYIKDFVKT